MSFLEIDFLQFHARILKEAELPQLTELCIACTDFFQLVEQQPGSEKTAREILQDRLPIAVVSFTSTGKSGAYRFLRSVQNIN